MSEQGDRDLEQAAEIVGTLKQFVKVLEDRTAEMINAQKLDHAQAREEGVKLRRHMGETAKSALEIQKAIQHYLEQELRPGLDRHLQAAATQAGKDQAAAFGHDVAAQIIEGTTPALTAAAATAQVAANALESQAQRLTWKGMLISSGAGVTCGLALVAVLFMVMSWYVPSKAEMESLRAERAQLQSTIDVLARRGGRMKIKACNERLCVLIDEAAGRFGNEKKDEIYRIPKGY
ncbi:MAG: hypothetical protein WCE48_02655 [Steroidobacteraceae bacterium]